MSPLAGWETATAVAVVGAAAVTGALGGPSLRRGSPPARAPVASSSGRYGAVPGGGRQAGGGRVNRARSARWADRASVRVLAVSGSEPGRLRIGTALGHRPFGGRQALAAEPAQSVAVVGPTQSGKTSSLAVPAILGWEGPVVATSVKTDLVRDTLAWRRRCGRVWCFDPGHATGLPASRWSPLAAATTWPGARRAAAALTEVARGAGTTADGDFWYATAAKLLAPLLFAAALAGLTMADVVRWVDTQEVEEVLVILEAAGATEAVRAARASWQREERQRSAVYTTAETVIEPYAEALAAEAAGGAGRHADDTPPLGTPVVGRWQGAVPVDRGTDIDPQLLLGGAHTLYACAPAHDQRRLRGLFVTLVTQVLDTAFARSSRLGGPLRPPLLVVLDEAANIAPLAELDGLAATCAGHGIQLVTVWQDLAQVRARYGDRAATVINNHRAKLFLSGISDPATLDHASHLIGDEEIAVSSVTRSTAGDRSVTVSSQHRPLLPPDALRRMAPGTGVLVYGALPPVRVALRPWFEDPSLAARVRGTPGAAGGSARAGRLQGREWVRSLGWVRPRGWVPPVRRRRAQPSHPSADDPTGEPPGRDGYSLGDGSAAPGGGRGAPYARRWVGVGGAVRRHPPAP